MAVSADDDAVRRHLCAALPPEHHARTFEKGEVLYDLGESGRTLFLIRCGVVMTGTTTALGREIVYDLRGAGDVVGELCAVAAIRHERAVALERTEALPVDLDDVLGILAGDPDMLRAFVAKLCGALAEARDQVNRLTEDSVMCRLVKVLKRLATKLGRPAGELVEIAAYLTQEELACMAAARRERVSTALNSLRRRGLVQYSARGHLLLDVRGLESDGC